MRQGTGEGQQLMRLGSRRDSKTLDVPGEEPAPEREFRGHDRPLDTRLDLQGPLFDGGGGGGQCQILSRIVPRLEPQESDQIAETPDESGLVVHAPTPWQRPPPRCNTGINFATPAFGTRGRAPRSPRAAEAPEPPRFASLAGPS